LNTKIAHSRSKAGVLLYINMIRTHQFFIVAAMFLVAGVFYPAVVAAQQVDSSAVAAREAELKQELERIEKEIAAQQEILKNKQRERVSFERDVAILNAQIDEAKLNVRAKQITIAQLSKDIGTKSAVIDTLTGRIERSKESLGKLLRESYKLNSASLAEVMLSNDDMSDFFVDLDSYDSIKSSLNVHLDAVRGAKTQTEVERKDLEERKNKELDAQKVIEAEKRKIERDEKEKNQLLSAVKNQEKQYETVLKDREKAAAKIRSALFGLRDTAAIPFGTALDYANAAYEKTGVRPAFLLAILTQESNLGENVGTCNRPGDPVSKSWKKVMHPKRDQPVFIQIAGELGFDPDTMPVSCPWQGGYGGAMGPAQFIPSTWNIYKARIAEALGVSIPNPWEPKHAFFASAIYLKDLGANARTFSAEREAALRYYAGGNWYLAKNAFYGRQVMEKATNIQENMIDPLLKYGNQ